MAKHGGSLDLSGLNNITLEVAEALAKHGGDSDAVLALRGLEVITVSVALALAKHAASLCLARAAFNTPEVVKALANHMGVLYIAESKERNPYVCYFSCRNGHKNSIPTKNSEKKGVCRSCGTAVTFPVPLVFPIS